MDSRIETLQLHGGRADEDIHHAVQTPVYQTVGYAFPEPADSRALLNADRQGFSYARMNNPTSAALGARLAAMDGGIGAIACASGSAAQLLALYPLMLPGRNIVASGRVYRGTLTQFTQTFRRFGWSAKIVDFEDQAAIEAAIDGDTVALFCEAVATPGDYITDIPAVAALARRHGMPLIVENSLATPALCRPIELGADIVTYSATKFLSGNGTSVSGIVVDAGRFDWAASGRYPALTAPEPAFGGDIFTQKFGAAAYVRYLEHVGMRDLGMTLNAQAAHYALLGVETLALRMKAHVANAEALAAWLAAHPAVETVNYAGLATSPHAKRRAALCPDGVGGLMTFALKGGYAACVEAVARMGIPGRTAHYGDARTTIVHPASSALRYKDGVAPSGPGTNIVRLSVGLEHIDDLIADFTRALG